MLEEEFYDNPFFTQAFPHFFDKELTSHDAPEDRKSWAESLLHRYKRKDMRHDDMLEHNFKTFVEGYRSPRGPIKWMAQEEKDKIHAQIDLEMRRLEDTGLSREEVLFGGPRGIPLTADPMFQYLKNNVDAREMLIKQGEEFTVETVVDKALRQEVDIDRSKTLYYKEYDLGIHADPDRKLHPRDFYWNADFERKKEDIRRNVLDDMIYSEPYIGRERIRRNNKIIIDKTKIKWHNLDLLSNFLTDAAKMKSRWQTRLPNYIQRKIGKAVKHARNLNLLPTRTNILKIHAAKLVRPQDEESSRLVINANLGTVYSKQYETEALYHLEAEDDTPWRPKSEISLSHLYFKPTREQQDLMGVARTYRAIRQKRKGFDIAEGELEETDLFKTVSATLAGRAAAIQTDVAASFLGELSVDPMVLTQQSQPPDHIETATGSDVATAQANLEEVRRSLGLS